MKIWTEAEIIALLHQVIGVNVQRYRLRQNLTIEELAAKTGMTKSYIETIKSGKPQN